MGRSRTNIEIDDQALATVMERYGLSTKTEAVDLALRRLSADPMTRAEALAMRGTNAMADVPDDVFPPGADRAS
ncbi:type II toxin-antitoxin system VapB family antitoxin [Euzebya tangerina]|uniref:type II toxin-antitoxin system VapB family antitoxin n=1 Tax=Euzebya tangerina TaxID=591198 RepID=UPI0013C2A778|nr:type II toxin-antitoxin system VapB family antitoxin [Euzebya tangerina]